MKFSLLVGHGEDDLGQLLGHAELADEVGLHGVWFGQHLSWDALSVALIAAQRTARIQLGCAVLPVYPRHPLALASQVHTVSVATQSRTRIGVGVSHRPFIEMIHGLRYTSPARYLREYLTVLRALIDEGAVDFDGEFLSVHAELVMPGAVRAPVYAAALGPQSLRVAGELAEGVITYLAGPRTLSEFVIPQLAESARDAGRPSPEVVASVPVMLTDDPDSARAMASQFLGFHTQLAAYRAIVEREHVDSPVDIAVIGDASQVLAGIEAFAGAGVTEFAAAPFGSLADERRTCDFLAELSVPQRKLAR